MRGVHMTAKRYFNVCPHEQNGIHLLVRTCDGTGWVVYAKLSEEGINMAVRALVSSALL